MEISNAIQVVNRYASAFFGRYHFLLFFCIAIGGLSIATFLLFQIVTTPSEQPSTSTSATFDTQTIEKIRQLKTADESSSTSLPAGRTNPF